MLSKNGVANISPATHLINQRGTNIQPKPLAGGSPVVIKVVSHNSTNAKQNLSGINLHIILFLLYY